MEFDREALDNQRAKLSNQRANVRSVLKRIGSEGLNPLARLQGEGLEKVPRYTYHGYIVLTMAPHTMASRRRSATLTMATLPMPPRAAGTLPMPYFGCTLCTK